MKSASKVIKQLFFYVDLCQGTAREMQNEIDKSGVVFTDLEKRYKVQKNKIDPFVANCRNTIIYNIATKKNKKQT